MNLILISSVINITTNPLSYTLTRSVYNKYQRFEQTLITMRSLDKIKDKKILFIEASDIPEFENDIINKVDFYKNVYNNNIKIIIAGLYKGSGEAAILLGGIKGVDLSLYDNIYKISGRYYLNDNFDYSLWENDDTILFEDINCGAILTTFYKINNKQYMEWLSLLEKVCEDNVESIEQIFKEKMKNYRLIENLGVSGNLSVSGLYWEY